MPPSAKEVVEKIPVNIKQAIVVRRIFFIGSSSVQFLYVNFAPGGISLEKNLHKRQPFGTSNRINTRVGIEGLSSKVEKCA